MTIMDGGSGYYRDKIRNAIAMIEDHGGYDGAHHKQWVLDQTLKILLGEQYENWVKDYQDGVDGPETYLWEEGTAP